MNRRNRDAFVLHLQFLGMTHACRDWLGILSGANPHKQQNNEPRGLHGAPYRAKDEGLYRGLRHLSQFFE
jgi:hypothetical protein